MSLTRIEIRNFQSLKQVDLDLGLFTVIVGPSSSGKSALIRAFRALASNVRGTSVITQGQKQMAITATLDPDVKVTLERSDRDGTYRISSGGDEQTFTKLAGGVPPQVTKALRLEPGPDSLNFAGQFDKPFLLDESGATVARQLGELTNVNQIFEAVRAANKVRNSTTATLRTRQADLAAVRQDLAAFQGLSEQLKALGRAQGYDALRKALQSRLGRLETAMRALRVTEAALTKYKPVELPNTTALDELLTRRENLVRLIVRLRRLQGAQRAAQNEEWDALNRVTELEQKVTAKLAEAGVCPTCHRPV